MAVQFCSVLIMQQRCAVIARDIAIPSHSHQFIHSHSQKRDVPLQHFVGLHSHRVHRREFWHTWEKVATPIAIVTCTLPVPILGTFVFPCTSPQCNISSHRRKNIKAYHADTIQRHGDEMCMMQRTRYKINIVHNAHTNHRTWHVRICIHRMNSLSIS